MVEGQPGSAERPLSIGEVARQLGVRTSALRYYEALGLVTPERRFSNGYRLYARDHLALLRFLKRAQALGITLREAKQLVRLVRQGERPCGRVRELARTHLGEIDQRIRGLEELRSELRRLLRRSTRGDGHRKLCPLIESDR